MHLLQLCMCFSIDGDHAITPEIHSKKGYFHLWLHCYNEGLQRLVIYFALWQQVFFQWWWIIVFSKVVTRWSHVDPHKIDDRLQHWFNWMFWMVKRHGDIGVQFAQMHKRPLHMYCNLWKLKQFSKLFTPFEFCIWNEIYIPFGIVHGCGKDLS